MMANTSPIGIPRLMPDQAPASSVNSPILNSNPPRNIPVVTPNKAANIAARLEPTSATINPSTSSAELRNFPLPKPDFVATTKLRCLTLLSNARFGQLGQRKQTTRVV
jgi:hypothetical protein